MYHYLQKEAYIVNSCLPEINLAIKHETSENQSDTVDCLTYPGRAGMGCFRLRLQGIRYSNKPAIRLKAIRERKNSLRSDNILSRINAAPRALTISNPLPQSPSASYPRPSRKVHQRGCIRLIFCIHPIRSISPGNHEVYYKTGRNGELCRLSSVSVRFV